MVRGRLDQSDRWTLGGGGPWLDTRELSRRLGSRIINTGNISQVGEES